MRYYVANVLLSDATSRDAATYGKPHIKPARAMVWGIMSR